MRTLNRHTLRLHISIQEYRGNMTIVNKAGNIDRHAYILIRWTFYKKPDNPNYVNENTEPQIGFEGISITDVGAKFFEEARECYKQDTKFHILTPLLDKD
ncbi:hypothetical protein O181_076906 [Austropuccinia psidii MF-1]|uniref:Uncharacterized protein n=1 Tax=Austropuccinia psidii MF-1 TaxID=1389203 RepID=A0A9Q3IBL3_9BASI|nr:hypothetical protein [Austropuccinia psidii MF-1]